MLCAQFCLYIVFSRFNAGPAGSLWRRRSRNPVASPPEDSKGRPSLVSIRSYNPTFWRRRNCLTASFESRPHARLHPAILRIAATCAVSDSLCWQCFLCHQSRGYAVKARSKCRSCILSIFVWVEVEVKKECLIIYCTCTPPTANNFDCMG